MREAWKRKTYVRSQSFSSESTVKYLHVLRRKIQTSPPLGEQDQSSALTQGQQRQSNPHPMPCHPPPPTPTRRLYIDRCIKLLLFNQFAPQVKSCSKWQSCQKVAPNSKSCQKVAEQLVAKASPFKGVEGRKYSHETSKFLRWIKNQSFLAMGLRSSAWNSAILFFGICLRLILCPVIVG